LQKNVEHLNHPFKTGFHMKNDNPYNNEIGRSGHYGHVFVIWTAFNHVSNLVLFSMSLIMCNIYTFFLQ
jgi:hypothetical protein